jgi:hypothetical protein
MISMYTRQFFIANKQYLAWFDSYPLIPDK